MRAASCASGLELVPPKDVTTAVDSGTMSVADCGHVQDSQDMEAKPLKSVKPRQIRQIANSCWADDSVSVMCSGAVEPDAAWAIQQNKDGRDTCLPAKCSKEGCFRNWLVHKTCSMAKQLWLNTSVV